MNRRRFLLGSGVAISALAVGAYSTLSTQVDGSTLTLTSALAKLAELERSKVQMAGEWSWAKVLNHCAQSIEYSMVGFPEHKSTLFKRTVGNAAFAVFSARGEMQHNLSEAIPGATEILQSSELSLAYQRLRQAMLDFQGYQGQLAEHFAFGVLDKPEYELAHVMHFYNHLQEVKVLSV
ncbi:DUF1569 domain-containing protein [Endozoicomonas sp. G2_1]|uniref:DUF1569 domain-containing protein n=1 Tax=Endozoicomonas sp. G2_1 TaxID=2821091 RepID=UPI001ADC66E8|nr:DUF1569 domain-containing protein [Endozoicomonas sp. G2_1]MBO9490069.1 DUF1569 domain-containing protein [Endozoicomonas sp. G2_1]